MMFDFFHKAHRAFTQAGVPDPLHDALNLCDILSNGALRALDGRSEENLAPNHHDLAAIANQRKAGKPLEYILQRTVFMGRPFTSMPGALIPRAETELLVQTVLDWAANQEAVRPLTIVDVGTGSGNIAVSLALALPHARVLALDISPEALKIAEGHVAQFGLQHRVSLSCGDLFNPLIGQGYDSEIDVIVCNPPYIPSGSLSQMAEEIVAHEPIVALDAGPYGIDIFRRLVKEAPTFLRPGGLLAFEIGVGQEALVCRLLKKSPGYEQIEPVTDHFGSTRVYKALRSMTQSIPV